MPKELVSVGASRKTLREFPPAVRRVFGIALFAAQLGEMPPEAKPLKGFGGASVLEMIDDYDRNTYRAVYTVRFATAVTCCTPFKRNRSAASPHRSRKSI
jgi:phage-related protein